MMQNFFLAFNLVFVFFFSSGILRESKCRSADMVFQLCVLPYVCRFVQCLLNMEKNRRNKGQCGCALSAYPSNELVHHNQNLFLRICV